MNSPVIIEKRDLKRLAKALHSIRFVGKPSFSYNAPIFETLVDLKKLLEDLFRKAAKNPVLRKRAGKAFRPNMQVQWWYQDKTKGQQWLWIGCEAYLTKPYKVIKSFGAALILYGKDKPEKYDMVAYVSEQDGNWRENRMIYRKTDINCSDFGDKAIKYWARVLK